MDTILIIEDEQGLARSLSYALESAGFKTSIASTGDEGLAALQSFTPSLILLDLILPGTNGIDVLKQIKSDVQTSDIPVIVLTNVDTPETIGEVVSIGKTDYLIKSNYSLEEIVQRVKTKLESPS